MRNIMAEKTGNSRSLTKTIIYSGLLLILSASEATAQDKKAQSAPQAGSPENSEVDISDIQNQYWKAHDKQFEVIQNKQYTKAGRIEITPLFGLYQRVDFQDTKTLGGSIAYHFTELWGVEVMAYKMLSSDSAVVKRFKETRNASVEFNEEEQYIGISPHFTPIYAKFSFLGKKISHFDLYIAPNLGLTKTNEYRFTYGLGVGQKFWLSPKWNIRVEYRWMQYKDRVNTNEGQTAIRNGGPGYFEDTVNNQNLMFGISYLFN
ncbi:MAG: outer membrane beta-barrel domain-containing protein [Bdellovibrionota bacterium]